ncbi:MAG: GDSL-type esterase/lipase family protein [Bacteroidota bacterium]
MDVLILNSLPKANRMKATRFPRFSICWLLLLFLVSTPIHSFSPADAEEHRYGTDDELSATQPDSLDLPEPQEGEFTEHYARMMRYHSRIDGNIPDRSVIFIGDSITQGLAVSAVATPSVNYGIGADTSVGVLHRIPEYHSILRSRAVVIAIGINDMRRRSDQEIFDHIQRIPTLIPDSVPIIFSAILPLNESNRDDWAGWNEDRIQPLNHAIREWASQHERLHFVNTGPDLVNADGNLASAYHIGDGIHLSTEGNAVWIRTLRSALEEIAPR